MRKIVNYTNETREAIITEQKAMGFRLVEDQRHFDGNHLIFEDNKPVRDPLAEIDEIKARVEKLEKK